MKTLISKNLNRRKQSQRAPTGEYDKNRLANLSTNTWTFIPGVAYTKIFPKANVEVSATWGLQFDTENTATGYHNGILSDLEGTVIKRFKPDFGIGVIGSWIDQLTDDGGTTADRLNGFVGRAFGVGPITTYSTKVGKIISISTRAGYTSSKTANVQKTTCFNSPQR